jgi:hypothetical protein
MAEPHHRAGEPAIGKETVYYKFSAGQTLLFIYSRRRELL